MSQNSHNTSLTGPLQKPVPFVDLIRETFPLISSEWKLALAGPALFTYVPLVLVAVPVCIIAFLVGIVVLLISKALHGPFIFLLGVIAVLLYVLVLNWFRATWTAIVLRLLRGESPTLPELLKPSPQFISFAITTFVIGVATTLGGFLLIVPGVFLMVRTAFAPFLVVDENLGPMEAMLKSNSLVTGYAWQILGAFLLLHLSILVAGFIPLVHFALVPLIVAYFDFVVGRIYLWQKAALDQD